jgi:integrase
VRGYTVKKGKQYYAVVYEGIDPGTGRERRRWIPAGPRRSDAERLVTDLVKRRNDGQQTPHGKTTLGEYLTEKWLPLQRSQLRPSTFDSYRRNIRLHVLPVLGRVPLQRLAPEDLDSLYARLLADGRCDGREGGLSVKTVRLVHLVLHKALSDALRKGSVVRNVATVADPPKLSSAKRPEIKVWTADQLRMFLDQIQTNRAYAALFVSSHTGMRRGEILGLRWTDVHFDEARLSIRQALISVAYEMQVSDVKTGAGRRSIDLDDRTLAVLRQWRKAQAEEKLLLGSEYHDQDLVFCRADGDPIHPDLFSQTFDRAVARLGLPDITLHDLRHTHASLLLKAGVPVKVVSERLGHASPAFTLNVYQHVIPGMQAAAAAVFSSLVAGAPDVTPEQGPGVPTESGHSVPDMPRGVALEVAGSCPSALPSSAPRAVNRNGAPLRDPHRRQGGGTVNSRAPEKAAKQSADEALVSRAGLESPDNGG